MGQRASFHTKFTQQSVMMEEIVFDPKVYKEEEFQTIISRNPRGDLYGKKQSIAGEGTWVTHGDNDAYWKRQPADEGSVFPQVFELKTVCWLDVVGTMRSVPPGRYVAYWRIKPTRNLRNMKANWWVGAQSRSISMDVVERPQNDGETVRFFDSSQLRDEIGSDLGRWVYLVLGNINVCNESDVHFRVTGSNPYWTGGIVFDYVGLYRLHPPWSVVRQLLMGWTQRGNMLNMLSAETLQQIISYL